MAWMIETGDLGQIRADPHAPFAGPQDAPLLLAERPQTAAEFERGPCQGERVQRFDLVLEVTDAHGPPLCWAPGTGP